MLNDSNIIEKRNRIMINQGSIGCTYNGSTIIFDSKIVQAFDSCKLDDDGWVKIDTGIHPNVSRYMALKDGAKAILLLFNTKTPEILKFRNGATVKLSTKVIQYQYKYRLKK